MSREHRFTITTIILEAVLQLIIGLILLWIETLSK